MEAHTTLSSHTYLKKTRIRIIEHTDKEGASSEYKEASETMRKTGRKALPSLCLVDLPYDLGVFGQVYINLFVSIRSSNVIYSVS